MRTTLPKTGNPFSPHSYLQPSHFANNVVKYAVLDGFTKADTYLKGVNLDFDEVVNVLVKKKWNRRQKLDSRL